MSQRAALLDLERKKLALLRQKVAEQERRVKTLESLDDDPFGALLEKELGLHTAAVATADVVHPQAQAETAQPLVAVVQTHAQPIPTDVYSWGQSLRFPRRVAPTWVSLLRFIGTEGKTYDQVTAFIEANRLAITPGAARTQLMNYRKDNGFVENPRKGFYQATQRALDFIEAQEKGDAAAGNSDIPDEQQPTPLDRAEA